MLRDLGDEHGEQAEDDGEADHDDGAGTHGGLSRLTRPETALVYSGRD
jgi:hypothetical protein